MAESYIQLPADSTGKKSHTFQKTIGANVVEDAIVAQGEPYLATYSVQSASISIATLDAHVFQIMAGSTLKVRIRRILVEQAALATTAGTVRFSILRLTTAGTGGTVIGVRPYDTADAAAGASCMTLPTVKGTEGNGMMVFNRSFAQAHPWSTPSILWEARPNAKPLIIPAGTGNGIALKNIIATAAATVSFFVEFDESSF